MKDDKSGLTHVAVALGAVVFFVAGAPILDALGTYVANVLGLKSVKLNAQAAEVTGNNAEEECDCTHAIGFQIPSEEDSEEIEDE